MGKTSLKFSQVIFVILAPNVTKSVLCCIPGCQFYASMNIIPISKNKRIMFTEAHEYFLGTKYYKMQYLMQL